MLVSNYKKIITTIVKLGYSLVRLLIYKRHVSFDSVLYQESQYHNMDESQEK